VYIGARVDTILHKIFERATKKPDSTAIMHKVSGRFVEVSWREFFGRVEALACALDDLGLKPGDRVTIQSWTRPEWTEADLAVTLLGAVVVPIYPQLLAHECRYILDHAEVRLAFCENQEQLDKIEAVRGQLPRLEKAFVFDRSDPSDRSDQSDRSDYSDLIRRGQELRPSRPGLIAGRLESLGPQDTMTIVYTSGTTGPPKGAVLANRGFEFNSAAVEAALDLQEGQRNIAYLPLAHAYERFCQYASLSRGVVYCYAESIDKLSENLKEIRPHIMPGVPRVYEKAYAAILEKIDNGPAWKRRLARWAFSVGAGCFAAEQAGRRPGLRLRLARLMADRLVFSKIRAALGGCLKYAVVSAAPVSPELCAFFGSLGVTMLEGWGMTETTAPATINPADRTRVGTAGPPFPGVDLRIDSDGEILVRAPNLLKEYYRDEKATRESFTPDGFFRTGDLGEFDEEGYLKIVGRKKDIIINSYGKNIAARNIEDHFMEDPMFYGCVVFGDNQKYLVAVLSLAKEFLMSWAEKKKMDHRDYPGLTRTEEVKDLVFARINQINRKLPNYEQIRNFVLSDHEFSVESGEITPTLKIKRGEVIERYRRELEALYG
jgi:long-chain acyl-CoA synthetase